jgi:hypothetical protein
LEGQAWADDRRPVKGRATAVARPALVNVRRVIL